MKAIGEYRIRVQTVHARQRLMSEELEGVVLRGSGQQHNMTGCLVLCRSLSVRQGFPTRGPQKLQI